MIEKPYIFYLHFSRYIKGAYFVHDADHLHRSCDIYALLFSYKKHVYYI